MPAKADFLFYVFYLHIFWYHHIQFPQPNIDNSEAEFTVEIQEIYSVVFLCVKSSDLTD